MSGIEAEAANIILPLLNKTGQVTAGSIATSTSSARTDLSSLTALHKGHFLTLYADGADGEDIYVAFTDSDAGAIDETATGFGVTVPGCIKAGTSLQGRLPAVDSPSENPYRWLIHKAKSGTPKLRVSISSVGPGVGDVRELRA